DRVLPQADRQEKCGRQSAAERPAVTQDRWPPSASRGDWPGVALILDAPHYALKESGPIGLGGREGAHQEPMETAQLSSFPLTDPTRGEMGRRGARRLLVQGAIEVGPQAPTSPVAGQHERWTDPPPTAILSAG